MPKRFSRSGAFSYLAHRAYVAHRVNVAHREYVAHRAYVAQPSWLQFALSLRPDSSHLYKMAVGAGCASPDFAWPPHSTSIPTDRGTLEISGANLMYEGARVKSWMLGRDVNPAGRGDGAYYAQGAFSIGSVRPSPTTTPVGGWGNSVNNDINFGLVEKECCGIGMDKKPGFDKNEQQPTASHCRPMEDRPGNTIFICETLLGCTNADWCRCKKGLEDGSFGNKHKELYGNCWLGHVCSRRGDGCTYIISYWDCSKNCGAGAGIPGMPSCPTCQGPKPGTPAPMIQPYYGVPTPDPIASFFSFVVESAALGPLNTYPLPLPGPSPFPFPEGLIPWTPPRIGVIPPALRLPRVPIPALPAPSPPVIIAAAIIIAALLAWLLWRKLAGAGAGAGSGTLVLSNPCPKDESRSKPKAIPSSPTAPGASPCESACSRATDLIRKASDLWFDYAPSIQQCFSECNRMCTSRENATPEDAWNLFCTCISKQMIMDYSDCMKLR